MGNGAEVRGALGRRHAFRATVVDRRVIAEPYPGVKVLDEVLVLQLPHDSEHRRGGRDEGTPGEISGDRPGGRSRYARNYVVFFLVVEPHLAWFILPALLGGIVVALVLRSSRYSSTNGKDQERPEIQIAKIPVNGPMGLVFTGRNDGNFSSRTTRNPMVSAAGLARRDFGWPESAPMAQ